MENQPPPRKPKLRWDIPMRQALCCIYRFFRCDKKAKEEIFFSMFRDNLRKRGINQVVPDTTLHAQWSWMRNTGGFVWSHVHRDTEFNMDGEWKTIIQKIQFTAVTLRLPLLEKTEDDIDTTQWGTRATMALGPRAESLRETPHRMPFPLPQREEERSRYFAESGDQSSESDTMRVGQSQELIDHLEEIDNMKTDESVVTSHGKSCLWCSYGLTIDEADGLDDQSTMSNDPEENNNSDQSQQPQHRHEEHQHWVPEQHHKGQQPQAQNQEHPEHEEHQYFGEQHHDQGQTHSHGQDYHLDPDLAMQGVAQDKLPPLLFRWSNRDSQGVNSKTRFLAGVFCDFEWFNPENISESRFESFFRSHVTKQKVRTPFISTFQSPLAPLHRAIAGQNGAILTVIDTSKLETKVFYACPLAIRTRTLVCGGWRGFGEYLIWGSIPSQAIAYTVEIASLQQVAQSHRDINRLLQLPLISSVPRCNTKLREMLALKRKSPFQSGRTLGKLLTLLQVPAIYWENLANVFFKAWGWRHKKEIALFLNGIRSGPPYLLEELVDSESEVPWPTPQKTPRQTPQKMHFSSNWGSDEDYKPAETDEVSVCTSESEVMVESRSISMCDKTETADDGNFSTHETLSSGIFPEEYGAEDPLKQTQYQDVIDLTSDNEESSSQRALQRDWPSDDDPYMYPDTPTKIRPLKSERKTTNHFLLNGQTDMDFFEKFRHWSQRGN
ncbi:hypothetical protein N7447_000550 [Penicillium robsamsonii]|uniref:uncharacterized protein n=1 Tax=Penicillium robsamsonii TaxID=1792511 RepID=UPI002546783B|nr:uncharacterized protein N7447_000550 [Penicillium robsamsonii]KAJ5834524.1 hypothetical protein N7447_000550 [Penicillium robsamsonii]